MEVYAFAVLFGLILVVLGQTMVRIKPNSAAGFKLPAAYASTEIWKKTNCRGGRIFCIAGPVLIIASLCFYFFGVPPETGGVFLGVGLVTVLVVTGIYLYFYSDRLFRETLVQPGTPKR